MAKSDPFLKEHTLRINSLSPQVGGIVHNTMTPQIRNQGITVIVPDGMSDVRPAKPGCGSGPHCSEWSTECRG